MWKARWFVKTRRVFHRCDYIAAPRRVIQP
jgi:hypothetical protein